MSDEVRRSRRTTLTRIALVASAFAASFGIAVASTTSVSPWSTGLLSQHFEAVGEPGVAARLNECVDELMKQKVRTNRMEPRG